MESNPAELQKFNNQENTMWKKIRSGVMFGIACITSPRCTPLIVPLALGLLAGTPLALWLSTYTSWVYGGLTLLSIISFILGFRWLGQKSAAKHPVVNERESLTPLHDVKL
jgi:hypothetical protein